MGESRPADRETVQATLARNRVMVTALAGGVLTLAAVAGFIDLSPVSFAERLSLPAGLAGLIMLVVGWHVYGKFRERAADVQDVATGCTRYSTAILVALALTEGFAFLGIVVYMLGGSLVALTGVVTHVLLTGVLWPATEKLLPFLGRAGRHFVE